jgi:hypothetical protein
MVYGVLPRRHRISGRTTAETESREAAQEGTVRKISRLSGLSVALLVAACAKDATKPNSDLANDLKAAASANLDLANQQTGSRYAATETAPKALPEAGKRLVKGPGPKAIQSPTPTVAAEPEPTVAAVTEIPQVQAVAAAAQETSTIDELPSVPRPVPSTGGFGDYGVGSGVGTSSRGTGVVLRGGGMGDDDHCEPVGGMGRARIPGAHPGTMPTIGTIYVPNMGGSVNRSAPPPRVGRAIPGGASAGGGPRPAVTRRIR